MKMIAAAALQVIGVLLILTMVLQYKELPEGAIPTVGIGLAMFLAGIGIREKQQA